MLNIKSLSNSIQNSIKYNCYYYYFIINIIIVNTVIIINNIIINLYEVEKSFLPRISL